MRSLRGYKGNENDKRQALKSLGVSEEKVERYGAMSEDELIGELMNSVREQKANNTFDPKQLETLVTMVSPRLNDEQQAKLRDLVRLLKNT